jgi:hypothetical protein
MGALPQVLSWYRHDKPTEVYRHIRSTTPRRSGSPCHGRWTVPKINLVSNLQLASNLCGYPGCLYILGPSYRVRLQCVTYPLITIPTVALLVHIFDTYFQQHPRLLSVVTPFSNDVSMVCNCVNSKVHFLKFCFSWIRDQQESEGVTPGEDVYIILRLDGRVRRSGRVIVLLWVYLV